MELNGKKICFLGDSITEGCCASAPELGFVQQMQGLCGLGKAVNYGIGGTRIARQHAPSEDAKYDLDFCGRYQIMDKDADIIVVFGGTNDHGHGDAPMGTEADDTPDTFRGACRYLFSGLKADYPDAVIVIATPLHRVGEMQPKGTEGWILADYVSVIRNTAVQLGLPVLDLFESSKINRHLEELTTDGLHPNDEGHRILAEEIGEFLRKL